MVKLTFVSACHRLVVGLPKIGIRMLLKLVSYKLCPYAQRVLITLRHKKVPYDIEFVDIAQPPAWLKELSPLGEVPIMVVDNKEVLFESSVICEFIDDTTPGGRLLPEDPLLRALDRSWMAYAGSALRGVSGVMHARTQTQWDESLDVLKNKMCWLQNELQQTPYFNGQALTLVDFAYAPLFMRMRLLQLDRELGLTEHYPKVAAWAKVLLALPLVQGSVVSNFDELFRANVVTHGPFTAQRLGWR